jgi:hypothetical protein
VICHALSAAIARTSTPRNANTAVIRVRSFIEPNMVSPPGCAFMGASGDYGRAASPLEWEFLTFIAGEGYFAWFTM